MRKLIEVEWFNDKEYIDIYNILNIENRMPPLHDIYVLDDEDVKELGIIPRDTVLAFALSTRSVNVRQYVWFKHEPPDIVVFAHEMIHIAKKQKRLSDEVYAYNLAPFVVLLAIKGIIPKRNPLRLFEDITIDKLEGILRKYGYNGIINYFDIQGVLPSFMRYKDGKLVFKEGYDEQHIVIGTIAEMIAGAKYETKPLRILLDLLELEGGQKC